MLVFSRSVRDGCVGILHVPQMAPLPQQFHLLPDSAFHHHPAGGVSGHHCHSDCQHDGCAEPVHDVLCAVSREHIHGSSDARAGLSARNGNTREIVMPKL